MAGLWTGRRRATSVDDYPGVLVSLDEAHLHSHTHGLRRRPGYDGHSSEDDIALEEGAGDGDAAKVAGEDEATAMLDMSAPEYSIEGLRREVRSGAKGERWTAYESKSSLLLVLRRGTDSKTGLPSEIKAHQQGHPGHWHGAV